MRLRRLWVPGLFIGLATSVMLSLSVVRAAPAWFLVAPPRGLIVCAERAMHSVPPASIHFEPGLIEHGNWIEFQVPPESAPNLWLLCLDGRGIARTPSSVIGNVVRFSLPTRFVDMLWLSGRLDTYTEPGPWALQYLTCQRAAASSVSTCS